VKEFMSITKALGDENRVRILMFLRGGELCVCQIIEMLQLAPSTVSKHLAILRQAGLIDCRKNGRWIHYRLAEELTEVAMGALRWVTNSLCSEKRVHEDDEKLKKVKGTCLEVLCNHYHESNGNREAA